MEAGVVATHDPVAPPTMRGRATVSKCPVRATAKLALVTRMKKDAIRRGDASEIPAMNIPRGKSLDRFLTPSHAVRKEISATPTCGTNARQIKSNLAQTPHEIKARCGKRETKRERQHSVCV